MPAAEIVIAQTRKWVVDVVAGCNFCPFVAKEVKKGSIHYEVLDSGDLKYILEKLSYAMLFLNDNPEVETTLLILPGGYTIFTRFLDLVETAESLLEKEGYEGIYQLASFHPLYLFAGTNDGDPANYTNRSPYPMLHILREASISKAADNFPGIKNIPAQNIAFATKKGLLSMQALKEGCMNP